MQFAAIYKKYKKTTITLLSLIVAFLLFLLIDFLAPIKTRIQYSQIITDKNNKVLHAFLSYDDKWRMKTELPEIIPSLKTAILYKEDKYFYYHPGINPFAVARAIFNNIISGKKTSGASTITMQVVRMLEPRERTFSSKFIEMFRALQLEWHYSKEEILQMYVNLLPYGGNIEGVKSASILYFGKTPEQLSLAEVVTLTIIPNRPNTLLIGQNNLLIIEERNKWLKRYSLDKIFPDNDIRSAFDEPLQAHRLRAPTDAPHLAYRLKNTYEQQAIIQSNLLYSTQEKTRQLCYNYIRRLQHLNIHNCAVLVVNNSTMEVEAYVGSSDFSDGNHSGQVDGIRAVRSPGSTLKPMIYAIGFDEGVITPKTILYDVPTDFEGYAPENFDKKFNGPVSVETALSFSLNIPAVKILEKITVSSFVQTMKKANFKSITKQERKLGLSTALGGCGVTLEELTGLFAAFAHKGIYSPLKFSSYDTSSLHLALVSPASAFMTTEILTQITRPDLPHFSESNYHIPKIAWKTGTSYGRRDAWSIGYNSKYTIGVWVGNFDGEGVHELSGADIATPLLFEIFNTLDYNSPNTWFLKPDELEYRFVCPESGMVAGEFCTTTISDYFIPKISSIQTCEHMKQLFVAPDESFCYCKSCLPEGGYKKKLYANLAPELIDFYTDEHIAFSKMPEHNPSCTQIFSGLSPKIISPVHNKEYILDKEEPAELLLKCNAHNEVKKVYWYIDDKFYLEATVTERVFFTPTEGRHKISCSDDKGRNTNLYITVKYQ